MNDVLYSSEKTDWATPRAFFEHIQKFLNLNFDVCADASNACLPDYWTEDDNALLQDWGGKRCWMNPPFGPGIGKWVQKAYRESQHGAFVACLLPMRTDTRWFHDYVIKARTIIFIKGRMRFSGHTINAPFPCGLVIFDANPMFLWPQFGTMDRILDPESK